jgi:hypothetical protein
LLATSKDRVYQLHSPTVLIVAAVAATEIVTNPTSIISAATTTVANDTTITILVATITMIAIVIIAIPNIKSQPRTHLRWLPKTAQQLAMFIRESHPTGHYFSCYWPRCLKVATVLLDPIPLSLDSEIAENSCGITALYTISQ